MDLDELTKPERQLLDCFWAGLRADFRGPGPKAEEVDADDWPADQQIRAQAIQWMLRGGAEPARGFQPRLRLTGARITGAVNLTASIIEAEAEFCNCWFDRELELNRATIRELLIVGCRLPGLEAQEITCSGGVRIVDSTAGTLDFAGSRIDKELSILECDLRGSPVALNAHYLRVENALYLRDCIIAGAVRLSDTRVAGQADFSGSVLQTHDSPAFTAENMEVDGSIFFADGFSASAQVDLCGARIGRHVSFSDASLSCPDRPALVAEGLSVGDLFARRLRADGGVRLVGADVTGQVDFTDAVLSATGRPALNGQRMRATDLFCRGQFIADGDIHLHGSQIAGHLELRQVIDGEVDLCSATVGLLSPPDAPTRLMGLIYEHLEPHRPARATAAWLARDPDHFIPGPYEQLAAYYRRAGEDEEARKILLAKRRARRKTLKPWQRLVDICADGLAGYGYLPSRAAAWLVGALATGTIYFSEYPPSARSATGVPPEALLLALDLVLPTTPLGVADSVTISTPGYWVALGLKALGWALSLALIPAIARSLARA